MFLLMLIGQRQSSLASRVIVNWRNYKKAPTVAQRRAKAARVATQLKKSGDALDGPVVLPQNERKIAHTFWGSAWCKNLESYHDYHSRLGRGRSYLRSGCVVALAIEQGSVSAKVAGSAIYSVEIRINALSQDKWQKFRQSVSSQISSLIELLQGEIPRDALEKAVHPRDGLFPDPTEIDFKCSCPDWANMCKHTAAVLYGIGNRLDSHPELFFLLRQCDLQELFVAENIAHGTIGTTERLGKDSQSGVTTTTAPLLKSRSMDSLGHIFGIELELDEKSRSSLSVKKKKPVRQRPKKKKPAKAKVKKQ